MACWSPTVRGFLSFFHETYFDYLFAYHSLRAGGDLAAFLLGSDQELFRRAQTRQVLVYLADVDREGFRDVVRRLLLEPRIRSHLKEVVAVVIKRLEDADGKDWEVVEQFVFDGRAPRRLEYILAQPSWFDVIDSLRRWPALLNDPDTVEIASHQLVVAARHRARRVVELIQPYVGTSDEWRLRIEGLLTHSRDGAVLSFAADLLARGELDAPPRSFAARRPLSTVIARHVQASPSAHLVFSPPYLRRAARNGLGPSQ